MSAPKLPWHGAQWDRIEDMCSTERLPHAILIKGPKGVGKSLFAERLCTLLLCMETTKAPCGVCRGCTLAGSGTHPDFSLVTPENESATISVTQIRGLIGSLTFTAALGRPKVGIIRPAERMTTAAANSLLKTLEEPPGDTVLILVAHTGGWLAPTLVSRCQSIEIPSVSVEQGRAWVKANISPEQDPDLLMTLSRGQPLTAVSWAQSGELSVRVELFEDFTALLGTDPRPVETASRWKSLGLERSAQWLDSLLMDFIKWSSTGDRSHLSQRGSGAIYATLDRPVRLKEAIFPAGCLQERGPARRQPIRVSTNSRCWRISPSQLPAR